MPCNTYERIPLDERLKRIAAGNASTPQFSRRIVDMFCDTKVIPVLESLNAFQDRQMLCDILRKDFGLEFLMDITFGDIAVLLNGYYLHENDVPSSSVQQLLIIFFMCFDAIDHSSHDLSYRAVPRNHIKPAMLSVYDFLHSSCSDYDTYAEECSIPSKCQKRRVAYRSKKCFSSQTNILSLYKELREDVLGPSDDFFSLTKDIPLRLCNPLFDFFICPIAQITLTHSIFTPKENSHHEDKRIQEHP